MSKVLLIVTAILCSIYLIGCGCGKDRTSVDEYPEAVSIEELAAIGPVSQAAPESSRAVSPESTVAERVTQLEPLPPAGPYEPTAQEIQAALKNAGFYEGAIDGKIGPVSEKAIKEFQAANNLEADGKVGLKTWAVLGKYLESSKKR